MLRPEDYFSAYEQMSLAESRLPVLMPYNRWIDPAGEQFYFGDAKLENHALDCALSADAKWLAVLGRYSIALADPLRKEMAGRFVLQDYFQKERLRNAYSGIVWSAETGVTPFGIASADGKIYFSNWAGARSDENDTDVAGIPWGKAKVDPRTGAVREGSVSVFDPADGKLLTEIVVGLHPNDIVGSPDQKTIYVANANSDNVSVIDTETDQVRETISVRLSAEENPCFGDSPNGLAVTENGCL